MILLKIKGLKGLIITNGVFLFVLVNIFLLSALLEFNIDYIKGVISGLVLVWIIYNIYAIKEIKRPGYKMDERMKLILGKSFSFSFIVFFLIAAFFSIISHAANIKIEITVSNLSAMAVNLMFIIFVIIFLTLKRRF